MADTPAIGPRPIKSPRTDIWLKCAACGLEVSEDLILLAASKISSARSKASGRVGRPRRTYCCPKCGEAVAGAVAFADHKRACKSQILRES